MHKYKTHKTIYLNQEKNPNFFLPIVETLTPLFVIKLNL